MNNDLNEYVKKKNYIGYIITGSAIIIGALWTLVLVARSEIRTDKKEVDARIAALHIYYQAREDKRDSIHRVEISAIVKRDQMIMDREREANVKTIEELRSGVLVIETDSKVNNKLAKVNDLKSKRNVKVLNEAHNQIRK